MEEHRRIGLLAADLGFDDVVTVGPDHGLAIAAGGRNLPDAATAFDDLIDRLQDGDVVLIKGSRSVGLEDIAQRFSEAASS